WSRPCRPMSRAWSLPNSVSASWTLRRNRSVYCKEICCVPCPGTRRMETFKMVSVSFTEWLQARVEQTEVVLDQLLPAATQEPCRLHEAMRYAVLGGGKRVRAALVYAAGEAAMQGKPMATAQLKALELAAAAVELIHAYSLVHDDLPCMDDDELRRGRPTVHIQFDEACAMLAGDALQPLAFELLAQMPIAPAL